MADVHRPITPGGDAWTLPSRLTTAVILPFACVMSNCQAEPKSNPSHPSNGVAHDATPHCVHCETVNCQSCGDIVPAEQWAGHSHEHLMGTRAVLTVSECMTRNAELALGDATPHCTYRLARFRFVVGDSNALPNAGGLPCIESIEHSGYCVNCGNSVSRETPIQPKTGGFSDATPRIEWLARALSVCLAAPPDPDCPSCGAPGRPASTVARTFSCDACGSVWQVQR